MTRSEKILIDLRDGEVRAELARVTTERDTVAAHRAKVEAWLDDAIARAEEAERERDAAKALATDSVARALVASQERARRIGWIDTTTGLYCEAATDDPMDTVAAANALSMFLRMVREYHLEQRAEEAERELSAAEDECSRQRDRAKRAERERDEERHLATLRGEMLTRIEREQSQMRSERDNAFALVAEVERERDACVPLATLPTEFAAGEWIMSGQAEPDAVVTYAREPSPETGHVGWCWWARGTMGEARDYMAARESAERALREHAKRENGGG